MATVERKRKSNLRKEWERKRRRFLVRFGVVTLFLAAFGAFDFQSLFAPRTSERQIVVLEIPAHASVRTVGAMLERDKIIRSAFAFRLWSRMHEEGGKFKAGRYSLSSNMNLAQIVQQLNTGPNEEGIRVTIPEGYTVKQIAALLQQKGIADEAAFLQTATNAASIRQLHADFPLPADTLEGYLFPDTYHFEAGTPVKAILEAMLTNFSARYVRPYQNEIAGSGRDIHSLVTLASLIEREARVPEDRTRIAGVLENRLKRNMRLEVDATVLYALGRHKEKVYYKDLAINSPYNTYRKRGLPPGAIANPGLPCLLAATTPEKNDYLYYVARPNGSHLFTRTLAEHEEAKRTVRAERQQQREQEGNGG